MPRQPAPRIRGTGPPSARRDAASTSADGSTGSQTSPMDRTRLSSYDQEVTGICLETFAELSRARTTGSGSCHRLSFFNTGPRGGSRIRACNEGEPNFEIPARQHCGLPCDPAARPKRLRYNTPGLRSGVRENAEARYGLEIHSTRRCRVAAGAMWQGAFNLHRHSYRRHGCQRVAEPSMDDPQFRRASLC